MCLPFRPAGLIEERALLKPMQSASFQESANLSTEPRVEVISTQAACSSNNLTLTRASQNCNHPKKKHPNLKAAASFICTSVNEAKMKCRF